MQDFLNNVAPYVRTLNIFLLLGVFVWFLLRASRNWSKFGESRRDYYRTFMLLVFALLYGTGESLGQEVKPGLRMFIITVTAVYALHTLRRGPDDPDKK